MLSRLIRVVAASLLALCILAVGGAGLALLAFRTDAFKSVLIASVLRQYHRRLELPGALQLRLFPPFTLHTGPMRLSARDGHTPFARAADMRLRLSPLALLRRKVVIEGVALDAPHLHLRREADGHWNVADLLTAPGGSLPALDIHRFSVRGATILLDDAPDGLRARLDGVDLRASGIGRAGWHALRLRGEGLLPAQHSEAHFTLSGQLHTDGAGQVWLRNLLLQGDGHWFGSARMLADLRADLQCRGGRHPSLQLRALRLRARGRMADGQPLQLTLREPLLLWQGGRTLAGALRGQALIGAAPRTWRLALQGQALDAVDAALQPRLQLELQRKAPTPLHARLQLAAQRDAAGWQLQARLSATLRAAGAPAVPAAVRGSAVLHWPQLDAPSWSQATGSAELQVLHGDLPGVDLRGAGAPASGAAGAFDRLEARARIADGVAQVLQLRLHTAQGAWQGSGSLDLASRRLRLWLQPQAQKKAQPHGGWLLSGPARQPRADWRVSAPADLVACNSPAARCARPRPGAEPVAQSPK